MRAVVAWIDKVQDEDGTEHCVYDIDYKPDGSELLVAADTKVLVYDGADGTLLQALKGHKDVVYCVSFSYNGEKFASGSADKSVIIWTEQHEGILKYSHSDALQCLQFSPVSMTLLSCAASDFGLWTQAQKAVNKNRERSRICSCAWSKDGHYYAMGLFNGNVSIRKSSGEEAAKIERENGEPVWAVRFNPNRLDESSYVGVAEETEPHFNNYKGDILAVADWGQNLSFYTVEGRQLGKEKQLGFDPCSLNFFTLGDFLVLGGSNRNVSLHTREGGKLGNICELDAWVWVVKTKPNSQFVAVGCQDGTLACYQLMFSTVHGLHRDRYAYRENMTDVVVQDLSRDLKVRIKCRDLVKKVAVYHHRLAIQLSDRVNVYRQVSGANDNEPLEYRILERIHENFECSLLVICSQHLILCQEKRLQCFDFRGLKIREWMLDALIRYIKVIGGPSGREAIIIGLKNGQVLKIFVDNPFPVELLHLKSAVRCLDLSKNRSKLAIVDEHGTCQMYDLKKKEIVYQEPNANSVAWNTECEDLLCFSGNGVLSVKAREFNPHQQKMQGFVVGFSGKRIFCLHLYAMTSQEVPLSNQLYQYIEQKFFKEAYDIATLGATETDWEVLAMEALHNMDLITAKKAFHRIRSIRFLELINDIEERKRRGETDNKIFLADISAYQGDFKQAAQLYQETGEEHRASEMYTDLRMFDKAQEIMSTASGETQQKFLRKRAEWAANSNDLKTAAEMFVSAGDYDRAVRIMSKNGWTDLLIQLARKVDRSNVDVLKTIAQHLVTGKEYTLAGEVYQLLNDTKALVQMHINAQHWEDAFAIAEQHTQFRDEVYVPYARWLAENDRFEEAQKAYHKAGRQEEALWVLEQLTQNAVKESRFSDAGHNYWMLSLQYLDRARELPDREKEFVVKFEESQRFADIYYAYHAVHRYMAEPFTSYQPDALLNISRFLLHAIGSTPPERVSKVSTLFTLAKQGKTLGAYKLARHAYEKLQTLKAPARFQNVIDLGALQIRSKPFQDSEDLLPMCYRCSTANPLLNSNGNVCLHCRAPFVFSFVSFEVLPMVQFQIEEGVSDQEAKELIMAEPPLKDDNEASTSKKNNPFTSGVSSDQSRFTPLIVDRATLLSLNRTEVIICEWSKPLQNQYYRNAIPEISVSKCDSCNRLFHTDDFELAVLQEGHCPFCRRQTERGPRKKQMEIYNDEED